MASLNRWHANFVFGTAACVIALTGTVQAPAQTRPQYLGVCADCHGYNGIGRYTEIPNIAGQDYYYMRKQLDNFLSGARRHYDMEKNADRFSDRILNDILDYYSRLSPR